MAASGRCAGQLEKDTGSLDLNKSSYEQYQAQREKNPDHQFKGELGEFQKKWEELLEQQTEL